MTNDSSSFDPLMLQEVRQTPQILERIWQGSKNMDALVNALERRPPRFMMTVARGSSDHAASFLKYAFEIGLGLPVGSAAPSLTSVYRRPLALEGVLVLAISQSGASPDVVESLEFARASGAITAALVNQTDSPLAQAAEFVLPLQAGEEKAVAATKSYLSSLFVGLALVSRLHPDPALSAALERLPEVLSQTLALEDLAREKAERYRYARSLTVLGRGLHYGVALEAALKLRETSGIQADAYSSAEFSHGPMRVVEPGYPILALQSRDEAAPFSLEAYRALEARGAEMLLVGADADLNAAVRLIAPSSGHRFTDPLATMTAVYLFAGHLALAKGLNPDAPPSLSKVTLTH